MAGYIVGILVAAIVVFSAVRYLILLRLWITEKRMRRLGKFHDQGQPDYGLIDGSKSIPMHNVNVH